MKVLASLSNSWWRSWSSKSSFYSWQRGFSTWTVYHLFNGWEFTIVYSLTKLILSFETWLCICYRYIEARAEFRSSLKIARRIGYEQILVYANIQIDIVEGYIKSSGRRASFETFNPPIDLSDVLWMRQSLQSSWGSICTSKMYTLFCILLKKRLKHSPNKIIYMYYNSSSSTNNNSRPQV